MSWSISQIGTKAAVSDKVHIAFAALHSTPEQDAQIQLAKEAILSEIAALPDDVNGVRVEASGHVTAGTARGRSLQIQVHPVELAL